MARADILGMTKEIIYGTGLGEYPPLRQCAANANESVSGSTVTFTLASGEGSYVEAGDVLSALSNTEAAAYVVYVLSKATDTLTCVNGFRGSTAIAGSDSGDLDNLLLEQNPLTTDLQLHQEIDTIISRFLYPEVFAFNTYALTSIDLSTGTKELNANVTEVLDAYQVIGGITNRIGFDIARNVHTTVSSTGVLGAFAFIDSSTTYITVKEKLVIGSDDTLEIRRLIATGAAALALGASVSEAELEPGTKDNPLSDRQRSGNLLWRDFLAMKAAYSEELSRDTATHFTVRRG